MGNYFTRQPEAKSPQDKCNDARSKIAQAREKYLKKLLKEEKISNGVAGDELDGKPKGRYCIIFMNKCIVSKIIRL